MGLSVSQENYLKAIYNWPPRGVASTKPVGPCARLGDQYASEVDRNGLIDYEAYCGATLTAAGISGPCLVRKHRLWEVFLVDKFTTTGMSIRWQRSWNTLAGRSWSIV